MPLQDPRFHEWLAEKCQIIFDEGYNVAWLDITESGWYNNANAYAKPVDPWIVYENRVMDRETFRACQQEKLDHLFQRFPDKHFFGNNIKGSTYFRSGSEKKMLTGEEGHHPMSGGSMEIYANVTRVDSWRDIVDMTLDFVRNEFWGVAWSKGAAQNPLSRRGLSVALVSS